MPASVGGGGLTGYTSETCLGTGNLVRSRVLQLVDQAWSDGLDGHPFRNAVSGYFRMICIIRSPV